MSDYYSKQEAKAEADLIQTSPADRIRALESALRSARRDALEEADTIICYESDSALALGNVQVVESLMRVREAIRALIAREGE